MVFNEILYERYAIQGQPNFKLLNSYLRQLNNHTEDGQNYEATESRTPETVRGDRSYGGRKANTVYSF